MNFDILGKVQIDPQFAALMLNADSREKVETVKACFEKFPEVLDWIGQMSGIHQPLVEPGVSIELNEGKRVLFLQILALIAAADLTEEQAKAIIGQS